MDFFNLSLKLPEINLKGLWFLIKASLKFLKNISLSLDLSLKSSFTHGMSISSNKYKSYLFSIEYLSITGTQKLYKIQPRVCDRC